MSEVVEASEIKTDVAPPKRYRVLAICEELFCHSRFVVVLARVFHKSHQQGFKLAERLSVRGVVACQQNLTREIAETLAEQADDALIQTVGSCDCQTARKIKFKVEEE